MPVTASYTWSEKKDSIKVLLPLKGVSANKVDILVSSATLKVNFAPFILDIVLLKEIDSVKHKASVKDGVLHITLCKKESGLWGSLEAEGDKQTLLAAKTESLQLQEKKNEEMNAQRYDRRLADEKHALRKQMKLEETERNRMDSLKHEEKSTAEREVYDTFKQMQMEERQKAPAKSSMHSSSAPSSAKKPVGFGAPPPPSAAQSSQSSLSPVDRLLGADDIDDGRVMPPSPPDSSAEGGYDSYDSVGDIDFDLYEEVDEEVQRRSDTSRSSQQQQQQQYVEEEEEEVRYIPPPRSAGLSLSADQKKDIKFTPRVFPTPMRESKAAEEEDWVAKNRRHMKNHGVLGKCTYCSAIDVQYILHVTFPCERQCPLSLSICLCI
jgi:dyslexia susceptibility 1 candidate gene 1 protein